MEGQKPTEDEPPRAGHSSDLEWKGILVKGVIIDPARAGVLFRLCLSGGCHPSAQRGEMRDGCES